MHHSLFVDDVVGGVARCHVLCGVAWVCEQSIQRGMSLPAKSHEKRWISICD